MTYKQTLEYLLSTLPMFHRIGAAAYKANLDNSLALDALLNHPHRNFKTIHIAGTNGKGSTSNMLAAVLQSAGYKTGLFTSPHLKDFRERIRINGEMISKKYVSTFVETHREDFEKISPSFFEWTVTLAFDYFRYKKVDIAVIETGLGGRLDSTNIITPEVALITNIGWDHMNLLGKTLPKIAVEKAGIMKPGVPVVIGETQQGIDRIFVRHAKLNKSKIIFADAEFSAKIEKQSVNYLDIAVSPPLFRKLRKVRIGLGGEYQLKNIRGVLSTIQILSQKGFFIPPKAVLDGIRNISSLTGFKGRWQQLGNKPLIIADTAHNIDGLNQVIGQINKLKYLQLHFIVGVVEDKEIDKILLLLPAEATYYFCQASIPRAMNRNDLKNKALQIGLKGNSFPTVKEAFLQAQKNAGKNDLIFIGGSTFTVAEIV